MNLDNIKPDTSLYAKGSEERGAALLLCKQAQAQGLKIEGRGPHGAWEPGWGDYNFQAALMDYRVYVAPPKPQVLTGYFAFDKEGDCMATEDGKISVFDTAELARADVLDCSLPARVFYGTLTEVIS